MSDYSTIVDAAMPDPQPNEHPPVYVILRSFFENDKEALQLILARAELGKERYGTYLQPFNGRPVYDDLLMELLDGMMYAVQGIMEGVLPSIVLLQLRDIFLLALSAKKEHNL